MVIINGISSSVHFITCGYPQRSGLGPLMFLLHMNNIKSVATNNLRLFADDFCPTFQKPKNQDFS